jgi:outer membrane protein assembly factor BamB
VVGLSTATGARQTGQGALTYWTPAGKGGIWSPPGPVVDADGSLLIATGNGAPATPPGDANSVIRLTPDLTVRAIFTAPDFVSLSESDRDLGSTSPSLVNGEVLQVGKEGIGYLLDSGLHLTNSAKVCAGGFGGTAVSGNTVFLPCFDGLFALQITPEGIDVRWKVASIRPGPPIVAGGAVWTVGLNGRLDGFDERSGRRVYGHAIAVAGSFPTLAAYNGVLYVPDGDRVAAFGGV